MSGPGFVCTTILLQLKAALQIATYSNPSNPFVSSARSLARSPRSHPLAISPVRLTHTHTTGSNLDRALTFMKRQRSIRDKSLPTVVEEWKVSGSEG